MSGLPVMLQLPTDPVSLWPSIGTIGHDLATSGIVFLGFALDVQAVLTGWEL